MRDILAGMLLRLNHALALVNRLEMLYWDKKITSCDILPLMMTERTKATSQAAEIRVAVYRNAS